jgi:GntR family transcriptional regulator
LSWLSLSSGVEVTVDRDSPLPLYYQLKQLLVERIKRGDWRPGDMLPTEQQLQEQYQLSRTTVRRAFRELEIESLITRYRGRGSFVAKPKVTHSPERPYSLTNFLIQQGMRPGWQVLSAEWVPASEEVANRLQIEPGVQVYCLRRLRLANDEPIGYHIAYVSPVFTDAIDESALTEGGSLRYLRSQNHLDGSYADRILESVPAGEEESRLLGVERGAPMLLIRRLVISQQGQPVEDFRGIYRGDRFQYHIRHIPAVHPINA